MKSVYKYILTRTGFLLHTLLFILGFYLATLIPYIEIEVMLYIGLGFGYFAFSNTKGNSTYLFYAMLKKNCLVFHIDNNYWFLFNDYDKDMYDKKRIFTILHSFKYGKHKLPYEGISEVIVQDRQNSVISKARIIVLEYDTKKRISDETNTKLNKNRLIISK